MAHYESKIKIKKNSQDVVYCLNMLPSLIIWEWHSELEMEFLMKLQKSKSWNCYHVVDCSK